MYICMCTACLVGYFFLAGAKIVTAIQTDIVDLQGNACVYSDLT